MAVKKRRTWTGRVYLGTDEAGRQLWDWVGRFETKREKDAAVAKRKLELSGEIEQAKRAPGERITCGEYAAEYVSRMESGALLTKGGRRFKDSSLDTMRQALRAFNSAFADRPLTDIERHEAIRWAERAPNGTVAVVVTLFGRAVDEELLDRSPFRGLGRRTKGRADQPPPTEGEMALLLDACSALGDYAPRMRALVTFAAYTGMRPGELFALEGPDIDLSANRVRVARRVYKGRLALPKSNEERVIALTPPAREALLSVGIPNSGLVFRSKQGKRLSQPTMTGYWGLVTARAGLDFAFYLATKHYAVHHLYVKLGLPVHVIATQMGWSRASVEKLIDTYGHGSVGALEALDLAFAPVIPLRRVSSDANQDAIAAEPAS